VGELARDEAREEARDEAIDEAADEARECFESRSFLLPKPNVALRRPGDLGGGCVADDGELGADGERIAAMAWAGPPRFEGGISMRT
jgi:hypothetical protein